MNDIISMQSALIKKLSAENKALKARVKELKNIICDYQAQEMVSEKRARTFSEFTQNQIKVHTNVTFKRYTNTVLRGRQPESRERIRNERSKKK